MKYAAKVVELSIITRVSIQVFQASVNNVYSNYGVMLTYH